MIVPYTFYFRLLLKCIKFCGMRENGACFGTGVAPKGSVITLLAFAFSAALQTTFEFLFACATPLLFFTQLTKAVFAWLNFSSVVASFTLMFQKKRNSI